MKAAEDRADGLLLELQCVQGEVARLASELDRARQAAQQRDRCGGRGSLWRLQDCRGLAL